MLNQHLYPGAHGGFPSAQVVFTHSIRVGRWLGVYPHPKWQIGLTPQNAKVALRDYFSGKFVFFGFRAKIV